MMQKCLLQLWMTFQKDNFFLVKKENEDEGTEFDVANIGELTDETLETTNQINNFLSHLT